MNRELWEKIEQFNLDHPIAEYGFSTRLAYENTWTKNFTQKAITEYKKFMYLAATSDYMVSPSEIVDVVWHQHLIFTQSYNEFCTLLGKTIQHIPSTHNRDEAERFKRAKERTKQLYTEVFGEQPPDIWEYDSMLDALELKTLKYGLPSLFALTVAIFFIAGFPLYYLLRPVYVTIDNPLFLIVYVVVIALVIAGLVQYDKYYFDNVIKQFQSSSIVYNLSPFELMYMLTGKLSSVTNCIITKLINESNLEIGPDKKIRINNTGGIYLIEDFVIIESAKNFPTTRYTDLQRRLEQAPVFLNMARSIAALKKHFLNSYAFAKIFLLNFCSLAFILLLGILRLATGISRDKPVLFIIVILIAFVVIILVFCSSLVTMFFTDTIPQRYKKVIVPGINIINNWEWQYFLNSPALMAPSLITWIGPQGYNRNSGSDGGSCGGGGCGGGGGGSCGGGGGCGGCGH